MSEQVVIEHRFRGPPESGNGGYTCGLVAARLEPAPAAEVTLRVPPPLDRPLALRHEGGEARLLDGETVVAEGRPASALELELPAPVDVERARRARGTSPLFEHHPFPGCFVCGTEREPGDGLCVSCGPVEGREDEVVAAPFETAEGMADEDGGVRPELVWAALDCPSGLAGILVPDFGLSVLGRLAVQVLQRPPAGPTHVAIGWPIEREGRKLFTGSAILDPDGEAFAVARATWIELRERQPGYGG